MNSASHSEAERHQARAGCLIWLAFAALACVCVWMCEQLTPPAQLALALAGASLALITALAILARLVCAGITRI